MTLRLVSDSALAFDVGPPHGPAARARGGRLFVPWERLKQSLLCLQPGRVPQTVSLPGGGMVAWTEMGGHCSGPASYLARGLWKQFAGDDAATLVVSFYACGEETSLRSTLLQPARCPPFAWHAAGSATLSGLLHFAAPGELAGCRAASTAAPLFAVACVYGGPCLHRSGALQRRLVACQGHQRDGHLHRRHPRAADAVAPRLELGAAFLRCRGAERAHESVPWPGSRILCGRAMAPRFACAAMQLAAAASRSDAAAAHAPDAADAGRRSFPALRRWRADSLQALTRGVECVLGSHGRDQGRPGPHLRQLRICTQCAKSSEPPCFEYRRGFYVQGASATELRECCLRLWHSGKLLQDCLRAAWEAAFRKGSVMARSVCVSDALPGPVLPTAVDIVAAVPLTFPGAFSLNGNVLGLVGVKEMVATHTWRPSSGACGPVGWLARSCPGQPRQRRGASEAACLGDLLVKGPL